MKTLSPTERQQLRARAHALHPVVGISTQGLSEAVLAEIDCSLKTHELVKVRIYGEGHTAREALLARICERLDAAPVQHIGNILVIYRENPDAEPHKAEGLQSTLKTAKPKPPPRPLPGTGNIKSGKMSAPLRRRAATPTHRSGRGR